MRVFIDTSAFIAQIIKSDSYHSIVINKLELLNQQHALFFTSDYILDELYTRLNYDHGAMAVKKTIGVIHKVISAGELRLIKIDQKILSIAEEILTKYKQIKLSFTDATSIAATKQLKIEGILTLDSDFKKAGSNVLPL